MLKPDEGSGPENAVSGRKILRQAGICVNPDAVPENPPETLREEVAF